MARSRYRNGRTFKNGAYRRGLFRNPAALGVDLHDPLNSRGGKGATHLARALLRLRRHHCARRAWWCCVPVVRLPCAVRTSLPVPRSTSMRLCAGVRASVRGACATMPARPPAPWSCRSTRFNAASGAPAPGPAARPGIRGSARGLSRAARGGRGRRRRRGSRRPRRHHSTKCTRVLRVKSGNCS